MTVKARKYNIDSTEEFPPMPDGTTVTFTLNDGGEMSVYVFGRKLHVQCKTPYSVDCNGHVTIDMKETPRERRDRKQRAKEVTKMLEKIR